MEVQGRLMLGGGPRVGYPPSQCLRQLRLLRRCEILVTVEKKLLFKLAFLPCRGPAKISRHSCTKNMVLDQVSVSYIAFGSTRTHICVAVTKQTTPVEGARKDKPSRSSHIKKICLLTKSQPPTLLLALSVAVFLFRQLNKLTL